MPPNWNHYTRIRGKRTIQQKQEQVKMTIDEKLRRLDSQGKKRKMKIEKGSAVQSFGDLVNIVRRILRKL